MATLEELLGIHSEQTDAVDAYIEDLLSQSGGDRDFAIRQLMRDHELSLGTDDKARSEFLESVADKLEERIGTIPYDYQVGTTRTKEDLARIEDVTRRNKELALSRLAEDEKTWRTQFADESDESRQLQGESLSERGILSGTREGAEGLAGEEVGKLETDLTRTLGSFERALGRERFDINLGASDTLFDARRGAKRGLEDLKTSARRGGIDARDQLSYGTEGANRTYDAKRKELERLRAKEKENSRRSVLAERYYN